MRLTPKASYTKIGDIAFGEGGQPYLKVFVTEVPEDNKANKALLALLSKTFHIPKSNLHIISGLTDRRKVIWSEYVPILSKIHDKVEKEQEKR